MGFLLGISSLLLQLQAQGLDSTRAMARRALLREDYGAAEALWMRVEYFSPELTHGESSAALGEICFQQGRYEEAADAYDYAARLATSDSLRQKYQFLAATSWLQVHDYAQARSRLVAMGPQTDPVSEQRRQFYLGSSAYGSGDFVLAEAHWGGCLASGAGQARLHALFEQHAKLGPRHPRGTIVLSALIPGLGQLAIGQPGKALNSLLLVGAIVGGGIYIGAVVGIADACLLFLPPLTRYHIGGALRAGKDAKAKLQERRAAILEEILDLVGRTNP